MNQHTREALRPAAVELPNSLQQEQGNPSLFDRLRNEVVQKAAVAVLAVTTIFGAPNVSPNVAPDIISRISTLAPPADALYSPDLMPHGGHTLPDEQPNANHAEAPAVWQGTIRQVEGLFDAPQHAAVDKAYSTSYNPAELTNTYGPYYEGDHRSYGRLFSNYVDFKRDKELANIYGQVVHDPMPYLRNIQDARRLAQEQQGNRNADASFDVYFENAQKYLEHFGVTIDISSQGLMYDGKPLAPNELESRNVKASLRAIIEAMAGLPQEYIDLANLKTIKLMGHSTVGGYVMWGEQYMALEAVNFATSSEVLYHEAGHQVDARLGGVVGARHDKQFLSIYTKDIYGIPEEVYTQRAFDNDHLQYQQDFQWAVEQGRMDLAEQLYNADQARRNKANIAEGGYGSASYKPDGTLIKGNAIEEKANLLMIATSPNRHAEYSDDKLPIMHDKLVLELARIGEYSGQLMGYFMARASYDKYDYDVPSFAKSVAQAANAIAYKKVMLNGGFEPQPFSVFTSPTIADRRKGGGK